MTCYNSELPVGPPGPQGPQGPIGPQGPAGTASAVTVKDAQGNEVTSCTEIRFTDDNALVTDLGNGIAEVNFVPAETTWLDIDNLAYYDPNSTNLFRPQYTIEGNKIAFRGLLFIPLEYSGNPVTIFDGNSYRGVASVTLDESNLSIIANSNPAPSERQGRFFTPDVAALRNFPVEHTPTARDITLSNISAYRRYLTGGVLKIYRTLVTLKIGSNTTVWKDYNNTLGRGALMVFAPYQEEYGGNGEVPLGNDPTALLISRATVDVAGNDYITATDNTPWTVPATTYNNSFDINAHDINDLGGMIINLEGLSGYLN